MLSYADLPAGLRDRIARIRGMIPAARARLKILVRGEEPPPPVVDPRGRRIVAAKPPAAMKEPPLSIRRLLVVLEAILLAGACWNVGGALHALTGGWPSKADFFPPRVKEFPAVRLVAVRGRMVWVSGAERTTLVRLGDRKDSFMSVSGLPGQVVTAVLPMREGAWIGTTRGLAKHDGKKVRVIADKGSPGPAHVTAICADDKGRLWVGTAKDGLFLFDGRIWAQFREQLANPYVTSLASAGDGAVWAGVYTGSISRTDGNVWTRLREAGRQRGSPIRRIVALGDERVLALTDRGLLLADGEKWSRVILPGRARSATVFDLAALPRGRAVALAGNGVAMVLDPTRPKEAREAAVQVNATCVATDGETIVLGDGEKVYRALPGRVEPLTNRGEFFEPAAWFPPGAECPADWRDPRYGAQGGRLALGVLLLGTAVFVRARRWRKTAGNQAWRILPLRVAGAGLGFLAVVFLLQRLRWNGRPVIASAANELVLYGFAGLLALWCFAHWIRIIRYEWKERADAFWTGVALTGSVAGAWLWWVHGALIPSLIVCAVAGLTFGRGLRALRLGTLRGGGMAWAAVTLVVQQSALLPPLVFAGRTWVKAALDMQPTYPVAEGLAALPERLAWAPDGQLAAYATPDPRGTHVSVVDGAATWAPVTRFIEAATVWPRPGPRGDGVAVAFMQGADTAVEFLDRKGNLVWRSRIPGRPAPGRQPCWEPGGASMLLLTYVPAGTQIWRVGAGKGDATKLLTVTQRLTWPDLSGDGATLACATAGKDGPGLAVIDLADARTALPVPQPPKGKPFLSYEPTPEGRAVLRFIDHSREALRHGLERVRDALQSTANFLGWRTRVPELWIRKTWKPPKPPEPGFRWSDYDAIRELRISVDGSKIACILRRAGPGTDLVVVMSSDGSDLVVVHRSDGHLRDLAWGAYKNRLAFVEETASMLAPFPIRLLKVAEGLPEHVKVRSFIPFTHWVSAPAFAPDGMRLTYAAPDRFWKISLTKPETYGVFDIMLESDIGVLPPPAARQESAPEKPKGGH